jgi:hypothetical protein
MRHRVDDIVLNCTLGAAGDVEEAAEAERVN